MELLRAGAARSHLVLQRVGTYEHASPAGGGGPGAGVGAIPIGDLALARHGVVRVVPELDVAVGAGGKTWRAYLSTSGGDEPVNAGDRIGDGPWYNFEGVMVAENVDDLHSDNNELSKENSVGEGGEMINGRGDSPNRHDILTGSTLDGMAFTDGADHSCADWTSNSADGSAEVGHHDRTGGGANPESWNAAHPSRGCGQSDLQGTGGDGLFYCFATD